MENRIMINPDKDKAQDRPSVTLPLLVQPASGGTCSRDCPFAEWGPRTRYDFVFCTFDAPNRHGQDLSSPCWVLHRTFMTHVDVYTDTSTQDTDA